MHNTNFTRAYLNKVNLVNVNLLFATLSSTSFYLAKNIPEWIKIGMDKDSIYTQKRLVDSIRNGFNNLSSSANLSHANLSHANLSFANLCRANLSCTNLADTKLNNTNLDGAVLEKTNLTNANLCQANLKQANFSYAKLIDTNLSYANLDQASLRYAYLKNTNFTGVIRLPPWIIKGMDKKSNIFTKTVG
ncbi:MAG: pentapeptide repeat-containing protein [Candidatus Magnetoglobus multicellularis str. Araruama]|uniref:Pentapeptide repeat-containing protein n=1 Tax=Candidatus Magnetoglobus multicellularis str. Araruama TaxID=890399 RepID=A0A1V1P319_9BACT|nr:MAG: pentapeptide repeat-containing protein [Candidatus Magnetoglobus multicellularis str. Araruama]